MSIAADVSGQDEHTVIALHGTLDFLNVAEVRDRLLTRDRSTSRGSLIVDLSGLALLDSSGLGMLVSAHKRAMTRGDELIVICPERLRRIFRVTGLEKVLTMHSSMPDELQ